MLTVKVMTAGGGEEIHCGKSIGYNPEQQSISIAGNENSIWLKANQVAYVMNESGKTISHYSYSEKAPEISVNDASGEQRVILGRCDNRQRP